MNLTTSTMLVLRALVVLVSVVAVTTARELVKWDSSGTQIVGYHHAPKCYHDHIPPAFRPPLPAIVLAHGLGGTQAAKLQPIAERFATEGYHAITVSPWRKQSAK